MEYVHCFSLSLSLSLCLLPRVFKTMYKYNMQMFWCLHADCCLSAFFFGTYVYMVKHVNIKYEKYSHSRSYIMFPETIWDMCLTITNSNHQLKPLVQLRRFVDSPMVQLLLIFSRTWASRTLFQTRFYDYQVVPQFGMAKLVLVSSTSDLWFIYKVKLYLYLDGFKNQLKIGGAQHCIWINHVIWSWLKILCS
jgi:hypothetical protein